MKVLIDTNVLMGLEDTGQQLQPALAKMKALAGRHGYTLCLHPIQRKEVERDGNDKRREILLSRMHQYQHIPSPPDLSEQELTDYGWSQQKENDRIDNLLLHTLCRGAVSFFVTSDKGIHEKAKAVPQAREQVHYPEQFVVFLHSLDSAPQSPPVGIRDCYLYEIKVDQPFFDSLRRGYEGFNEWYIKVAQEGRKAWCVKNNDTVQAICIYKEEAPQKITDEGYTPDGAALKLSTFKIGEELRGQKLGERLLFSAFQYAKKQDISYIYLHTFGADQEMLVSLCQDHGFRHIGTYGKRDDVYLKEMRPPSYIADDIAPLDYVSAYYPYHICDARVRKFIVPIMPRYHEKLFADTSDMSQSFFSYDINQYPASSNTIRKAYLCHSNIKQIQEGDLLFFYRTRDRRSVECSGVVEQAYRSKDIDRVLPLISKRTVYNEEEVMKLLKKETLVLLFLFTGHFSQVTQSVFQQAGVQGAIQSIRQLTHDQYLRCFGDDSQ